MKPNSGGGGTNRTFVFEQSKRQIIGVYDWDGPRAPANTPVDYWSERELVPVIHGQIIGV